MNDETKQLRAKELQEFVAQTRKYLDMLEADPDPLKYPAAIFSLATPHEKEPGAWDVNGHMLGHALVLARLYKHVGQQPMMLAAQTAAQLGEVLNRIKDSGTVH
jgi:hypothetical protein